MHSNYKERGLFPHNPTKSSALDLPALLVKIVLPGNEIETSFFRQIQRKRQVILRIILKIDFYGSLESISRGP